MHTKRTVANTQDRYHPMTIWMHWGTFILMIAVYALIEFREFFPKGSNPREAMKQWHFMLGMVVFGLVFVRLILHRVFHTPPIDPAPPIWIRIPAKAMHLTLYAFLIVMPVLGWLALNAKAKTVPFFGLSLPTLIGIDKPLGDRLEELHEVIGIIGYYLIGLHAAAALFHHYFIRDNALRRMLPGRSSGRAAS